VTLFARALLNPLHDGPASQPHLQQHLQPCPVQLPYQLLQLVRSITSIATSNKPADKYGNNNTNIPL
jgi:hypothetical protein